MIRVSTIFIAVCMVLIAIALGLTLYLMLGLTGLQASVVALAAFTVLVLYNAISMRLRDRTDVGTQIADLSRGTADLARQVGEFGRRLAHVEERMAAREGNDRAALLPLQEEIAELGGLVQQLAASVANHDDALQKAPPAARPAASDIEAARATTPPGSLSHPADSNIRVALPEPANERGPTPEFLTTKIRRAVDANRLDLYLQPLVTLPQRKVRFYEAVTRLRDEDGDILTGEQFVPLAEKSDLIARIDHMVMFRCVQVLRRLLVKNKDIGLFCNVSRATLGDPAIFRQCLDFLDANVALAPALVFEFKQSTLRNMTPRESEHMAALVQKGFRLSIDHVETLRIDPKEMADRGIKFVKVAAPLLLDQNGADRLDIHPADLSDLLGRHGIDLVAERIEGERAVVDLLDYDVRYGQGFLFAPPKPLRIDTPSIPSPTPAAAGAAE